MLDAAEEQASHRTLAADQRQRERRGEAERAAERSARHRRFAEIVLERGHPVAKSPHENGGLLAEPEVEPLRRDAV